MYSVQQLQAFDYLLKTITATKEYPLYEKNLKLAIEYNGLFLYGDFIQMKDRSVYQQFIDNDGNIETDYFYRDGSNANAILYKTHRSYVEMAAKNRQFWTNPFKQITDPRLLFSALSQIIAHADIQEEDGTLFPYLYNTCSIDGQLRLPFIDLSNEQQIKLISLIEIAD